MKTRASYLLALGLSLAACGTDNAATTTSAAGSGTSGAAGAGGSGAGGGGTGGAGGGQAGGRPSGLPATETSADIGAFLKAGGYKMSPWVSDVAAPRPMTAGSQHGDNVRVWLNQTLVDAIKAGHDGQNTNPPPDQWSMAVKEFYDAMNMIEGYAVALKTASGTGGASWTYFCYGPGSRCLASATGTEAMPIYGKGNASATSACGICHGYSIFTKPPM